MARAEEILRIKLGNKASKAASRVAAEGVVGIHVSPDATVGLEAAAGGAFFFLGGLGLVAEVVGDLFYGTGTREVATVTYPVLSGQLGLIGTYEVLP